MEGRPSRRPLRVMLGSMRAAQATGSGMAPTAVLVMLGDLTMESRVIKSVMVRPMDPGHTHTHTHMHTLKLCRTQRGKEEKKRAGSFEPGEHDGGKAGTRVIGRTTRLSHVQSMHGLD